MALVELSVMEQRYDAVMAILQDGWKITEVADRLGVTRQTVRNWIIRYEKQGGLPALADRSHRPKSCSHQIAVELEVLICEMRSVVLRVMLFVVASPDPFHGFT